MQDAELAGITEERDRARTDLENTHLSRDEVVHKAWEVRDTAVARKNVIEIELAKTRIDVMQANSQLMEAIQQKVELSQQLEQWQVGNSDLITVLSWNYTVMKNCETNVIEYWYSDCKAIFQLDSVCLLLCCGVEEMNSNRKL